MTLLKKDGIEIHEVNDYHIYPIADNDTPMLSADRLEYSLSNALFTYETLEEDDIRTIYEDISIQKNEKGIDELGFQTKKLFTYLTASKMLNTVINTIKKLVAEVVNLDKAFTNIQMVTGYIPSSVRRRDIRRSCSACLKYHLASVRKSENGRTCPMPRPKSIQSARHMPQSRG